MIPVMSKRSFHATMNPLGLAFAAVPKTEGRLIAQLEALRAELSDLAFSLEKKGRHESADVVISVALRVNEMLAAHPSEAALPAQG